VAIGPGRSSSKPKLLLADEPTSRLDGAKRDLRRESSSPGFARDTGAAVACANPRSAS